MRSSRWMGWAFGAALFAACGGGPPTVLDVEASGDFLAQAASRTLDEGTARVEMTMTLPGPMGDPIEVTVSGAYDSAAGVFQMTLDPAALFDGAIPVDEVPAELQEAFGAPLVMIVASDERAIYMGWPAFEILGGAEWLRMDLSEGLGGLNLSESFGAMDPVASLQQLAGAEGVEEVGTEEVRGVETTHFHATVVPRRALDALPDDDRRRLLDALEQSGGDEYLDEPIDQDVYVDADGRVRRVRFALSVEGEPVEGTMDFFDFGADVDIAIPEHAVDAAEVFGDLLEGGD